MSKVEKYLDEKIKGGGLGISSAEELDRYLGPKKLKLVSKVSKDLKWSIPDTYAFILRLLEDVNAHSVKRDVERIFLQDL